MKRNYMNALTFELVNSENFMPVRDRNGNYALYDSRRVLQLKQGNNIRIAEVIDGDRVSAEDIDKHCRKNVQWLLRASAAGLPRIIDIFVFDRHPDPEKERAISRHESGDYCLIITDLASKEADCPDGRFEDNTLLSSVRKAYYREMDDFEDLDLTYDVIRAYNDEIMSELLPGRTKATHILIIATALVFLADFLIRTLTGSEVLKNAGVKQSFLITAGEYWRLLTPMFLHADIMHLGSNMFSLYILGQTAEKYFGPAKLTAIYLMGGFLGNIFSYTLTRNMSLGASGAVFAVGGAVVVLWKMKASRLMRMSGKDMMLVILIGINVILGFSNTGIDNWAHLGGLAGGIMLASGLGYRNSKIKKEYKALFLLAFILTAIIVFYSGYEKWSALLQSLR